MEKVLLIIAGVLGLVATLGFAYGVKIEFDVQKLKRELEIIKADREMIFENINKAIVNQERAAIFRNHAEVLKVLNTDKVLIDNRNKEVQAIYTNAILIAATAAYGNPAQKEFTDKLNSISTLDEAHILFGDTMKLAGEMYLNKTKEKSEKESLILRKEQNKFLQYKIFVIINSVGLFLAVIAKIFS